MSGRSYDFSKLDGKVETYDWEDHHSPAIHILFEACESIHQFLLSKFLVYPCSLSINKSTYQVKSLALLDQIQLYELFKSRSGVP